MLCHLSANTITVILKFTNNRMNVQLEQTNDDLKLVAYLKICLKDDLTRNNKWYTSFISTRTRKIEERAWFLMLDSDAML